MSILSFMRSWLTVQPATVPVGRHDIPSGERIDDQDVLALSAAYACVRLLSGNIGGLPIEVMRPVTGSDGVQAPDRKHPIYRLLHDSPNGEQTAFEFFEEAGASIELKGNALALKDRTGERTTALLPMRWDETRVYRRDDGAVGYEWKQQKLTAADVLHIRGFGGDALGGLSTITTAGAAFGLAKAVNRAAGSTFRNGIRTQTALVAERDLSPEQMVEARALIDENYTGAMNSGRPLLLNNGLKAVPLQMNPEEAQMLESRAFSVEEVCRIFGVPPFMIGHTEKSSSWGTGIEQQKLGFLTFTLRPRLKRIEQALAKQLLSAEDRAAGVTIKFNVEALLRADSKGRAEFYNAGINGGWLTRNEARAREGLPPVKGGDTVTVQMQQVPLGEWAKPETLN